MHAFSNVRSLVYLCLEGCLLGGQRKTKERAGVSYDVVLIAFHEAVSLLACGTLQSLHTLGKNGRE